MKKVILVLAGNYKQYQDYISAIFPIEARKKYIYVESEDYIRGLIAESVVETGTFYEKKNAYELKELALSRVRDY